MYQQASETPITDARLVGLEFRCDQSQGPLEKGHISSSWPWKSFLLVQDKLEEGRKAIENDMQLERLSTRTFLFQVEVQRLRARIQDEGLFQHRLAINCVCLRPAMRSSQG